jgi:hypothetical protein
MAGKEVVMLWPCRVCSHNSIQHTAAHNGTLNNCNATSSVCFVYFFHNSQGQSKTCTCKLIPKVGLKHIIAMVLGREICRCIQMPSEMVYIYIYGYVSVKPYRSTQPKVLLWHNPRLR